MRHLMRLSIIAAGLAAAAGQASAADVRVPMLTKAPAPVVQT
jgi:hypothetical protein